MDLLFDHSLLQVFALALIVAAAAQALLLLIRTLREITYQQRQQQLALDLMQNRLDSARARHFLHKEELQSWRGQRKFVVANTVRENDKTVSVYLAPHDGRSLPVFRSGQHLVIRFKLPGEVSAINRCYSISSSHNPEYYRITVKQLEAPEQNPQAAPGQVSSYINQHLKQGDILDVKAPKGDFYLDTLEQHPLVLLSGGIGITPFISMLMTLSSQRFQREVWLFHSVRSESDDVFKDLLELLAKQYPGYFRLFIFYTRTTNNKTLPQHYYNDHLSLTFIRQQLRSNNFEFYVCGPPSFMHDMISGLQSWDVPDNRICYEAFGSDSIKELNTTAIEAMPQPQTLPSVRVNFSRSGRTLNWNPSPSGSYTSLLDFALAHNIVMNSGCRAGECSSCEVAVKEGKVRYLKSPSEPPEVGNCLPCICVPADDFLEIDA